ncbi:MAG: DNA-methyltransferase [Cetobacterium sp.]
MEINNVELYSGDCLQVMDSLIEQGVKVDMILCDLPYGVTKNDWDKDIIPLNELWKRYNKIIKDNGAIVLFGQDKFTAKLMMSNVKNHRYNLIWDKVLKSGFLNCNRMPLRQHEDICVFYKKLPTYNPQKFEGEKESHSSGTKSMDEYRNCNYGKFENVDNSKKHGKMKFPTSILKFEKPHPSIAVHPTQKPVDLCEWLIKTYTNENEIVLDNTMGSGSTGVACLNTNRRFIGIEQNEEYMDIACQRIKQIQIDLEEVI